MLRRVSRMVLAVTVCLALPACDHYEVAGAPEPRPVPAPTAALGSGSPALPPDISPSMGACAPIVVPAPAAIVETVRAADGVCIPAAEAVAYRCDPSLDPVVALDLQAKTRRFLGGRFATDVHEVPAGALPVGIIAAGRLWVVPGDDGLLYVEGSAGAERWLVLPRRRDMAAPPAAMIIGDSLLEGAQEETVAELPGWMLTIDAEVGRGSYGAASVAEAIVPPMPEVLVVEIGVNDHDPAGFATNLARVMAAADEPQLLLWLTAHGPDPETDDINAAIRTGVGKLSTGAIIDWDALVPSDSLDPDGVHLLADHQHVLTNLVAGRLRAWRQAASGEGATGCEDTLRASARG